MIYLYLIAGVWGSYYIIPEYYGTRYRDFNASDSNAVGLYWSYLHSIGSDGNLYMVNPESHTVSILDEESFEYPGGLIRVIVGVKNKKGFLDGDASSALLNSPKSSAFYSMNQNVTYSNSTYSVTRRYLFIADTGNSCIRRVDLDLGEISEYVGRCTVPGFKDGPPGFNRLNSPNLVGNDENGNLYIFDSGNSFIRFYNATESYLYTLINGACRSSSDLNSFDFFPSPYYDITSSKFQTLSLSIHTTICIPTWIKTSGEPSGHIYNPVLDSDICRLHDILCDHRTHPLVTGNA